MALDTSKLDVLILAGGRGTRLPISAQNIPKALVEVRGASVLSHQLAGLRKHGVTSIHFALGFRADQITNYLKTNAPHAKWFIEEEALGTGGAVKACFSHFGFQKPIFVLNGDVMADFDFTAMADGHKEGMSYMAAHHRTDARDFGLLEMQNGVITSFGEKPTKPVEGYINAGCYLLDPEAIERLPQGVSSIERDLFPSLAAEGKLAAHIHEGAWEDIGTEERLEHFRAMRTL